MCPWILQFVVATLRKTATRTLLCVAAEILSEWLVHRVIISRIWLIRNYIAGKPMSRYPRYMRLSRLDDLEPVKINLTLVVYHLGSAEKPAQAAMLLSPG